MTQAQRAEFDTSVGLDEAAPVITNADLPPELQGKKPPAWWLKASDGGSWRA